MSFTIKLAGTPYEFKAEATETILEAGDKAGFLLPSACRSGACGACKAQIISGTVALGPHEPFALTETRSDSSLPCQGNFRLRNQS